VHFTMVFKETNYVEGVGPLITMHSLLRIVCVNFAALSCEPIYGYHGDWKPEYSVLDGQLVRFVARLIALAEPYCYTFVIDASPNRRTRGKYDSVSTFDTRI
jgi:hypothetical protein